MLINMTGRSIWSEHHIFCYSLQPEDWKISVNSIKLGKYMDLVTKSASYFLKSQILLVISYKLITWRIRQQLKSTRSNMFTLHTQMEWYELVELFSVYVVYKFKLGFQPFSFNIFRYKVKYFIFDYYYYYY